MKNSISDPEYVAYLYEKWKILLTSPLSGSATSMLIEPREIWEIPKDE
jgi:hypothetical protein